MDEMKHSAGIGPQELFGMAMAFKKSQVLFTATSLGIFEELSRLEGAASSEVIAENLQLHSDATGRLLNACCAFGLTEKTSTGFYRNSVCAEQFLTSVSRCSIIPIINNIGEMYKMFSKLPQTIKDGRTIPHTIDERFDEGAGFYKNENDKTNFLSAMHFFSSVDMPDILTSVDLFKYKSLVDLGGGTGALGYSLASAYPQMEIIVSDLKHVIKETKNFLPEFLPTNLSFESKNFFKDPLTRVDVYVLSHVVHDWEETAVHTLLDKVYNAINPGGCLLVLEKVLNKDKTGPPLALCLDLNMLICKGGRERTAEEYVSLLGGHGFVDVTVKRLPAARYRDVIVARKAVGAEGPEL